MAKIMNISEKLGIDEIPNFLAPEWVLKAHNNVVSFADQYKTTEFS